VQAATNSGYITNNGSTGVAVMLPTAPAIGDQVQVIGLAAWTLIPNFNQTIIQNMAGTGAVTGGGLSGALGDSVLLQYVGNNTFMVTAFVGHINSISSDIFVRNGVIWTPPTFNINGAYTWADGTTYCTNTTFGGLGGWRLPTSAELVSLDNFGVKGTHGWPATAGNMWTSDIDPSYANSYGVVAFTYGVAAYQPAANHLFVACARS
jgi:hypothetical protein